MVLQPEASAIKGKLLKDFLPDDVCPLGAHLFTESPGQIYQCDSKDNKAHDSVLVCMNSTYSFGPP